MTAKHLQRLAASYKEARLAEETFRAYMRIAFDANLENLERKHQKAMRRANDLKYRLEVERRVWRS